MHSNGMSVVLADKVSPVMAKADKTRHSPVVNPDGHARQVELCPPLRRLALQTLLSQPIIRN
jgi:hypothetical protein